MRFVPLIIDHCQIKIGNARTVAIDHLQKKSRGEVSSALLSCPGLQVLSTADYCSGVSVPAQPVRAVEL